MSLPLTGCHGSVTIGVIMNVGSMRSGTTELPAGLLDAWQRTYGPEAVARQQARLARDAAAIDDPSLWLQTALARDFQDVPIERRDTCACGARALQPLCRFVFWNLLGVNGCGQCGALVVSPRLTDAAVARLFTARYFADHPPTYWGERRRPVFRQVHALLAARGVTRVLDVGAAYGHLLAYLRAQEINGVGCDISESAVTWGRGRFGLELHTGGVDAVPAAAGDFDAVLSIDSLYYSADPLEDLRIMQGRLRRGGWMVLRLRTAVGAWRRAARQGARPVGKAVLPADHRWALPPAAVTRLLTSLGLDRITVVPGRHSVSWSGPWLDGVALLNEGLRHLVPALPVLTRSYLIVARRP